MLRLSFVWLAGMVLVAACDSAERPATPNKQVMAKPTVQSAKVELATGITMHYAVQGSGDSGTILMLHGYLDSWFSFSEVMVNIPAGYKVYAVDQRGHGESTKPDTGYLIGDFAADAIAFMDAMGIARAVLVGHSMGTFVSQRVAIDHPERVAGLVLIASAPKLKGNPVLAEIRSLMDELTDPVDPDFIRELQEAGPPGEDAFMDRLVAETGKVPAQIWRTGLDGVSAADASNALPRISAPTLILAGENDVIFPLEMQLELARLIPGSTLKIYQGTGHGMQWEQPERATRDIMAFLENGPVAGSAGGGCAPDPAVAAEIDRLMQIHVDGHFAKDVALAVSIYTKDFWFRGPNGLDLRSRAEVSALYRDLYASADFVELVYTSDEVLVCGNTVINPGHYTMTTESAGRQTTAREHYVLVWLRQPDGSLRLARGAASELPED